MVLLLSSEKDYMKMARRFFDEDQMNETRFDRKRDKFSAKEMRREARANKHFNQTNWMDNDEE